MSKQKVHMTISTSLKQKCDDLSEETGLPFSSVVTMALMVYFEKRSKLLPEKSAPDEDEAQEQARNLKCWNDGCKNNGKVFQGKIGEGCPACGSRAVTNA